MSSKVSESAQLELDLSFLSQAVLELDANNASLSSGIEEIAKKKEQDPT